MTVAAVNAALAAATAGDSVEISSAARAASDRLTAGTPQDAPPRPLLVEPSFATAIAFRPDVTLAPGHAGPARTADTPRWDRVPYAPNPLSAPPRPDLPVSGPDVSRFAKTVLVVAAMAAAVLLAVMIG